MNNIIMLIFTGVIAASTVFYTIYSARLWKVTKRAVDSSRYTEFINFMIIGDKLIKDSKDKNHPGAIILEQLSSVYAEFGAAKLINEIDFTSIEAQTYFKKIISVLDENGINPESISWLKPIIDKIKK